MEHSVFKEDQVHLDAGTSVEILEEIGQNFAKLDWVLNFLVKTLSGIDLKDVREHDFLLAIKIIESERGAEAALQNIHGQISEPEVVGLVDKTILKHARGLVCPKLLHGLSALYTLGVAHENALDDLGDITQVKHVVELRRSGTKVFLDLSVNFNCALNNRH